MAKLNRTRQAILQVATNLFLEKGYTQTSPKMICERLDISLGNMTYYFPTKEHMLSELTDMLCQFQWKLMDEEANEGISSILALCLELTSMASACESNEAIKDFFIASYTSPMCLETIRKNDAKRAKEVFAAYRSDWTDEQFGEAEILVSGIEYATLMTTAPAVALETRITGALHNILGIYGVDEETRNAKIHKVFNMDYKGLGPEVLEKFKEYVKIHNEEAVKAFTKK